MSFLASKTLSFSTYLKWHLGNRRNVFYNAGEGLAGGDFARDRVGNSASDCERGFHRILQDFLKRLSGEMECGTVSPLDGGIQSKRISENCSLVPWISLPLEGFRATFHRRVSPYLSISLISQYHPGWSISRISCTFFNSVLVLYVEYPDDQLRSITHSNIIPSSLLLAHRVVFILVSVV